VKIKYKNEKIKIVEKELATQGRFSDYTRRKELVR
jgi:hypothetical protein